MNEEEETVEDIVDDVDSALPTAVTRKTTTKKAKKDAFAALLARPPITRTIPLAMNPDDAQKFMDLRLMATALDKAAKRDPESGDKAEAAAEAAEEYETFSESIPVVHFTFKSLGNDEYDELVSACPPSKETIADIRKKLNDPKANILWEPDVFKPALIAASCCHVEFSDGTELNGLTEDQVEALWSEWPDADLEELFGTANRANQATSKVESLGKDL